ncbi:Acetyltransferase (GNAT) domain-containing protein [Hymenobacter gelipurpurascens]|uniref:Acetyltransferase (GNAT) domain-containing protein n=1 Tax=Hymenobacter gelipurpurascens TaxID=89968 RepID=A0A212UH60_9BACT|nr:GNAT family N-acetyltransferase [Hymenobacter gelipurpurascens]SNC77510.1 Acetyltransferase (GNAT) domain-containing protein [Hymenobacter gelipurpurascens]
MPLRLLRHHEIDLAAWDACVSSAREVVPYAHSWWLQATAGRWDALVKTDDETGRYLSIWPLPIKRRLSGLEVYQPPFTQQLGLLTSQKQVRPAIREVWDHRSAGLRYTKIYTQFNDQNELVPAGKFSIGLGHSFLVCTHRQTYQLSLAVAYETLEVAYAADYRRRLRQLYASRLTVRATTDAEPLLTLFQETKGYEAGLKRRHYSVLRNLLVALQQRQLSEILEVWHPETKELLAAALFVKYRTRLIYLFAAASAEGKKAGAPLLLLDHQIRRYAGTPGLILDFEGGMIPSIARFFANFGATPVPYAAFSCISHRPWYLSWMR